MTDAIHGSPNPKAVVYSSPAAVSSSAPRVLRTPSGKSADAYASIRGQALQSEKPATVVKTTAQLSASDLARLKSLGVNVPGQYPVLAEWTGPHGGVPAFDKVKVADFEPAFDIAMQTYRDEVNAIANSTAPATFDNTILALEKSGRMFQRLNAIFGVWSGNLSSPEFQAVEQKVSPKIAAFSEEAVHNDKLWARIKTVFGGLDKSSLNAEQKRLVWLYRTQFVLGGADLAPAAKARASEITGRLAELYTTFSQHQLADESKGMTITDAKALEGLPQEVIDGAAEEAKRRGVRGWVIANTRSAMEPLLTYSSNRAIREQAFRMWTSRGDNGDANDNNKVAEEILKLRAERSKLLGYPTYAHWHLADTMAQKPENALELMQKLWKPAVAQVKIDVAEMQKIIDAEGGKFKLAPWDYRFYAEKVRKERFDVDLNEVKPYLQVDNLVKAMFASANKFYGLTFEPVTDVPTFHPEVKVYKVLRKNGEVAGLWYFDPFARDGKNSGAWMTAYREQQRVDGDIKTIVSNNSNFIKGKPGSPSVVSWDDAETMFHEFGHALNGLESDCTYPTLSGTNTARDFVEFPSQFNENYLMTPEALKLLVNEKGELMPQELIDKLHKSKTFNAGFNTVELLASALVDMKLHLAGDADLDMKKFEKTTLDELGMPAEIVMRHRIPAFGHIFSGEGYAAGYYGYPWANALAADAYGAFEEAGDPYDPATTKRFNDTIESTGNTIDGNTAFMRFRGRKFNLDALLKSLGFPTEGIA